MPFFRFSWTFPAIRSELERGQEAGRGGSIKGRRIEGKSDGAEPSPVRRRPEPVIVCMSDGAIVDPGKCERRLIGDVFFKSLRQTPISIRQAAQEILSARRFA